MTANRLPDDSPSPAGSADDRLHILRVVLGSRSRARKVAYDADELRRVERLGEVGVRPEFLTALQVIGLSTGRYEHHLDVTGCRVVPEPPRCGPAVHARHHHIDGDDVRGHLGNLVEAVLAIHGGFHLEAFKLEVHRNEPADDFVIVDDEHPARSIAHEGRLADLEPTLQLPV